MRRAHGHAALVVTVAVVNTAGWGWAPTGPAAAGSHDRAELARLFARGPCAPLTTLVPPALLRARPAAGRPAAPPPAGSAPARSPCSPPRTCTDQRPRPSASR